ncbi:MAG TPA: alpha/beta hydrolase [Acidimicrobiales bacterium]|nr:alpha/beta hydrolase [Acidimicrobiales bacterium]
MADEQRPVARRHRRAIASLVVLAVGLGGCGGAVRSASGGSGGATGRGAGTPAATAGPPGPLRWVPCRDGAGPAGAQCATLSVPLDPTAPGGATVALAIDRLPATGHRVGSLVVNPGGPGISAVDAVPAIAQLLPADVRRAFDVVGYDPPGVGHSAPVTCLDQAALGRYLSADPEPPGPAGFATLVATARGFAAACQSSPSGPLLAHVNTLDAARDLDAVRAALGDTRLSYLGFSYGTLLGATYASLYPTRVRAMVLDGALDPTLAPLDALAAQGGAVDAQLGAFAAACRSSRCPWRPVGSAEAALGALVDAARAGRLGGGVGAAQVLYGTARGLYSTASWPQLGRALAAAAGGDGTGLADLFRSYVGTTPSGGYSTEVEAETAVDCTDVTPPTLGEVQAATARLEAAGALFSALDVASEATCSVWPAPAPAGGPHPLTAPGAPPIVVVGSTGDPITPYAWARHLAAELGSGVLLTRVGDGHTALPASGCVRSAVATYLVGLVAPAPGTRCPSD